MFSASFDSLLPRDAMRKRDLRVARYPSVCPSRWCTHAAEDIVKLLVRPGSPSLVIILRQRNVINVRWYILLRTCAVIISNSNGDKFVKIAQQKPKIKLD